MRNILILCILLIPSIGCDFISSSPVPPLPSVLRSSKVVVHERENVSYDFSLVVTVGNRSYIPVNKPGNPADMVTDILNIIDQFEKKHPEWEIISWHIEKQQKAHITNYYVFGLWVDHQPKTAE